MDDGIGLDAANDRIQSELQENVLTDDARQNRLDEHSHHLIRWTEPTKTVHRADGLFEVEIEAEDAYCFTCGEWLGLAGIEWPGTPRSKADAYWLDGPPDDVIETGGVIRWALKELAEVVIRDVEHIETAEEALQFIIDQVPDVRFDDDD